MQNDEDVEKYMNCNKIKTEYVKLKINNNDL